MSHGVLMSQNKECLKKCSYHVSSVDLSGSHIVISASYHRLALSFIEEVCRSMHILCIIMELLLIKSNGSEP